MHDLVLHDCSLNKVYSFLHFLFLCLSFIWRIKIIIANLCYISCKNGDMMTMK